MVVYHLARRTLPWREMRRRNDTPAWREGSAPGRGWERERVERAGADHCRVPAVPTTWLERVELEVGGEAAEGEAVPTLARSRRPRRLDLFESNGPPFKALTGLITAPSQPEQSVAVLRVLDFAAASPPSRHGDGSPHLASFVLSLAPLSLPAQSSHSSTSTLSSPTNHHPPVKHRHGRVRPHPRLARPQPQRQLRHLVPHLAPLEPGRPAHRCRQPPPRLGHGRPESRGRLPLLRLERRPRLGPLGLQEEDGLCRASPPLSPPPREAVR